LFRTPLLISTLTFWICAPLDNILKNTILTDSTNPPLALNKSKNCMGSNMSPVMWGGKFSKSALSCYFRQIQNNANC
jgi:hypothetical protein